MAKYFCMSKIRMVIGGDDGDIISSNNTSSPLMLAPSLSIPEPSLSLLPSDHLASVLRHTSQSAIQSIHVSLTMLHLCPDIPALFPIHLMWNWLFWSWGYDHLYFKKTITENRTSRFPHIILLLPIFVLFNMLALRSIAATVKKRLHLWRQHEFYAFVFIQRNVGTGEWDWLWQLWKRSPHHPPHQAPCQLCYRWKPGHHCTNHVKSEPKNVLLIIEGPHCKSQWLPHLWVRQVQGVTLCHGMSHMWVSHVGQMVPWHILTHVLKVERLLRLPERSHHWYWPFPCQCAVAVTYIWSQLLVQAEPSTN